MSGDCAVSFRLDNGDMVGLVRTGASSGIDVSLNGDMAGLVSTGASSGIGASLMFNCRVSAVEAAANAGMTVPNSLVRSASCGLSLCHFAIPMGELVVRLLRFKISPQLALYRASA